MKNYIVRTEGGPKCTHPQVEKYWEWGGCSVVPGSKIFGCASVNLKNGEQHDFRSEDNFDESIAKCEEFLNTIPE